MTTEFKTNPIENPKKVIKLGEQFEFSRTEEEDIRFRIMVTYQDDDGMENKMSLGDGVLPLSEFISWSGSKTDFEVPLFLTTEEEGSIESAVINLVVEWTPENIPDDYEPPEF